MLRLLAVLWLAVYITMFLKRLHTWIQTERCKRKLSKFTVAYSSKTIIGSYSRDRYAKELNALLRYYPVISEYIDYPKLSYSDNDLHTYMNADDLLNEFKMIVNFKRRDFLIALNPLTSISEILYLPTRIAALFGVQISKSLNFLVDIISGVAVGLLDAHIADVIVFVRTFFETLIEKIS